MKHRNPISANSLWLVASAIGSASGCATPAAHAPGAEPSNPISTDRPGFLFSPLLVPVRVLQVEAGIPQLAFDAAGGDETSLYAAPVQLRYGLHRSLELRVGASAYNVLRADDAADDEGFGTVELGAKVPLALSLGEDAAALVAGVRLPTGEDPFTVDGPAPSLNAVASWALDPELALTALAGIAHVPIDGDDDALVGSLAGLASRSLGAGWTGSLEAAWFPASHASDTAYAGLLGSKLLTDDLQLDVSVDRGLTDDSADWLAGIGISFRF